MAEVIGIPSERPQQQILQSLGTFLHEAEQQKLTGIVIAATTSDGRKLMSHVANQENGFDLSVLLCRIFVEISRKKN